jgi:hypothetical protein
MRSQSEIIFFAKYIKIILKCQTENLAIIVLNVLFTDQIEFLISTKKMKENKQ